MANRDERKTSNPHSGDQEHNREQESPDRAQPEGPGGRLEKKGETDARDKTTRRGER